VQPPTNNREDILAAIDRFQLQRGTAVGSGILVSLKVLFPDAEFDLRSSNPRGDAATRGASLDQSQKQDKPAFKPVPAGSDGAAVINLLTDGQTTTGPEPRSSWMAAVAASRCGGHRHDSGELIGAEGWSMRVRLDEASLKTIANLTQGEYFYAGTANDLKVYESLNSSSSWKSGRQRSPHCSPRWPQSSRSLRRFFPCVQPDTVSGLAGQASSSAFVCCATAGPVNRGVARAAAPALRVNRLNFAGTSLTGALGGGQAT
jgi:hypothetical protein